MRAIAAGLTDIGRERNHNEDRFILLPEFNVFVVADGMGGHQSGEVASRMAAATIASYFRSLQAPVNRPPPAPPKNGGSNGDAGDVADTLKAAVCDANAKIFARADDSRAHRGMGTTVVAAAYRPSDASMHVVHAGDSRAYHIRGDSMKQLTRDHSLLSDALLERPELTEADLAYLPRNVITRALGIAPTVDVDAASCPAQSGDVFLLCSDGLHGLVDDSTICSIVREHDVLTEACSRLIDAANRNGGKDNITAVLIRIEDEEEPWSVRSPGATPRASTLPEAPVSSIDPAAPTDPSPELLKAIAPVAEAPPVAVSPVAVSPPVDVLAETPAVPAAEAGGESPRGEPEATTLEANSAAANPADVVSATPDPKPTAKKKKPKR